MLNFNRSNFHFTAFLITSVLLALFVFAILYITISYTYSDLFDIVMNTFEYLIYNGGGVVY
jgi:hypothetical protein